VIGIDSIRDESPIAPSSTPVARRISRIPADPEAARVVPPFSDAEQRRIRCCRNSRRWMCVRYNSGLPKFSCWLGPAGGVGKAPGSTMGVEPLRGAWRSVGLRDDVQRFIRHRLRGVPIDRRAIQPGFGDEHESRRIC